MRSPGSALKPFIYALAFQDGLVGPETVLDDLPRRFGGYAPENFDRGFAGTVTAATRCGGRSTCRRWRCSIASGRCASRLRWRRGGEVLLPRRRHPSLPLALGGAGITLRQAAGLYAALATDGKRAPLRLADGRSGGPRPFLEPRAAATVAAVLTQRFPDAAATGVAWKTGTSWGGRDAWAMGFDRAYVVARLDRPAGRHAAARCDRPAAPPPLLSRVFDLLPAAPRAAASRRVAVREAPAAGRCIAPAVPAAGRGAVRTTGRWRCGRWAAVAH